MASLATQYLRSHAYGFALYTKDINTVVIPCVQRLEAMSVVISVRIPRKLKEEMGKLKGVVNWNEEIRRFLESRVEELCRIEVLKEVCRVIKQLPEVPRDAVTSYLREDRDSD